MTIELPDVVADPIGVVVQFVTAVESAVDSATIQTVVARVAGGRAKRRRLARALLDRPTLLVDGRSPAPRVAGDLLIALRQAGAGSVCPPCCAECGKQLRTMQRRGENWYCHACGPHRERCVGCGNSRPIASRDREGRPHCVRCPPEGHDPVEIVIEVLAAVDPAIPTRTVAAAVQTVTSRAGQRRQLAWALQDRPELLTGAGAEAVVPSVLRLIDELCRAGATRVVRPACPGCGRQVALVKPRNGLRLCRTCIAKSRAEPCVRCGVLREPATRDEHGGALCPHCLVTDPANQESCIRCGRRRRVSVRGPDGPLCENCRPVPMATCSICGRSAPCWNSTTTGEPWCRACKQRWARCAGCRRVRPVRGGTTDQPTCATCTRPDPAFWRQCPTCGQPGQLRPGQCPRCTIDQRLRELLSGDDGQIHPELQALHQNLASTERPTTVVRWLDKRDTSTILRDLGTGKRLITHQALDELPPGKPIEHLRAILVAVGVLPDRDEHMARLERWTARVIASRADPDEQQLLHRYTDWHLLRRLRRRTAAAHTTHTQAVGIRRHIRAAIGLLDWLSTRSLALATCQQADLDSWLTDDQTTGRRDAGHFIRWAKAQKLTSVHLPATRWGGPADVIDTETRWEQARWLLHDTAVAPDDRVAGLLVLLYAQWPAAISRLTLTDIQTSEGNVRIRLGPEPVVLPAPLAGLVLELRDDRRGHAALGDQGSSPWLFPGGQPGRPLSAYQLAERLRQLGIRSGRSRSTALFQLATELPAAILARMLGIHIGVAAAWQRASSGDWMNYAADYSRRTQQHHHAPTTHRPD